MANIKKKKGRQAPEPEEDTLTLIEEGPARSSRTASPPRRLGDERIRRASGAAETHQDAQPPERREDGLIGDAAPRAPHRPPLLPPETRREDDEEAGTPDPADGIQ
jgi:hypothetical protein